MNAMPPGTGRAQLPSDGAPADEVRLLAELREGSEEAFAVLVGRYHTALVRLACVYVQDRAMAEEVAQETWLGVLQGLERFEGRSSLKTWIFRILVKRARTRGKRESRTIPFSAVLDAAHDPAEPPVDAECFLSADHPRWPGHWARFPSNWNDIPEERVLSAETRAHIEAAIEALPPQQREVITLRDIEGWGSVEVCNVLGVSETNQRVLLHRARSKVRRALERHLEGD
jgi:RNA polymerase sigma-70 factor (ECF subfamily)